MRRAQDIDLALRPRPPGLALQQWLYTEIRQAILSGRLIVGQRLPATRDFAKRYHVSRGTVSTAFDQLQAEGFIQSAVGRGSFVSADTPRLSNRAVSRTPDGLPEDVAATRHERTASLSQRGRLWVQTPFSTSGRADKPVAFRASQPDLHAFPFDIWGRLAGNVIRRLRGSLLGDGEAQGYLPLRNAIAEHIRTARGIPCTGADVLIVNSVQQILDLAGRLLLDPGDEVWLEDPGYPGAHLSFRAAQAVLVTLPVDGDGVDVQQGIQRAPSAKLAYVTAGHQSPLGTVLSLDRRLSLLAWAKASDAFIIEDDYDSEFRFHGRPLAAMKSLDDADRVIYCGTFSKLLAPGIRIAYAVVPAELRDAFVAGFSLMARHVSVPEQAVLHHFIADGHFGRHVRRMRLLYAERAEALSSCFNVHLGGAMVLPPITTGLDVPAMAIESLDVASVAQKARKIGVEIRPLSFYAIENPAPSGFLLGFAAVTPEDIERGVKLLSTVIAD